MQAIVPPHPQRRLASRKTTDQCSICHSLFHDHCPYLGQLSGGEERKKEGRGVVAYHFMGNTVCVTHDTRFWISQRRRFPTQPSSVCLFAAVVDHFSIILFRKTILPLFPPLRFDSDSDFQSIFSSLSATKSPPPPTPLFWDRIATIIMPDTTFQFVDWTEVAGPTQNPATRVLIRKQAMSKAAAARRERGNWGKRNVGQSIMVLPEAQRVCQKITSRTSSKASSADHRRHAYRSAGRTTSSSEGDSEAEASSQHGRPTSGYSGTGWNPKQDLTGGYKVPLPMASTGYEMLRVQCDFDILDLSALTTFHVGRITTEGLYASPKSLIDVLRCRQWSYFSYIPCRYGQFPYLDDAAQCVASRVRGWMVGEIRPSDKVISLYLKALNSLQAAVNDPDLCTKPETLCATAVLSIYEVHLSNILQWVSLQED